MKKITLIITSLLAILAFSLPSVATENKSQISPAKVAIEQQKLNLNTADAKEIANKLTGVGMKKAVAIVEYRKANGGFKNIEELAAVKGIGIKTIAKNEGRILLK